MSGQLSWTRDGETLALRGELDQDLLVPLWEARAQATDGVSAIDLSAVTRVDTAGLALLVHFIAQSPIHQSCIGIFFGNGKAFEIISFLKAIEHPIKLFFMIFFIIFIIFNYILSKLNGFLIISFLVIVI